MDLYFKLVPLFVCSLLTRSMSLQSLMVVFPSLSAISSDKRSYTRYRTKCKKFNRLYEGHQWQIRIILLFNTSSVFLVDNTKTCAHEYQNEKQYSVHFFLLSRWLDANSKCEKTKLQSQAMIIRGSIQLSLQQIDWSHI